jgi:integrase
MCGRAEVKETTEKKRKRRHVPQITRSVLERVRLARGNRYFIMEGGGINSLRGFGLEVGRAEVKYIIRKDGFPTVRLGLVHELTPEEAREQAAAKLRDIRAAKGNSSIMTGLRLTIEELAKRYHEAHADQWTPKTIEEYKRLWRLHLLPHVAPEPEHRPPLGKLKLPELTPARVVVLKRDIAAKVKAEAKAELDANPRRGGQVNGMTVANRALQQLTAAYQWAIDKMEWLPGPNPASEKKVDRFKERPSKATIGPEQYQALGQALQKIEAESLLPARTLAAIRLILRTGCRPHEILTAELAWVQPPILLGPDFDLETLADPEVYIRLAPRIERPRGKGDRHDSEKEGRTIWLSPGDVAIIRSVPRYPGCRWVIPGDKEGTHLVSLQKAWELMCKLANVEGVTPKTARHAFRSQLPSAGVEPEHGMELLGHTSLRMMEKVYWHREAEAQARAAALAGGHVEKLLGEGKVN